MGPTARPTSVLQSRGWQEHWTPLALVVCTATRDECNTGFPKIIDAILIRIFDEFLRRPEWNSIVIRGESNATIDAYSPLRTYGLV